MRLGGNMKGTEAGILIVEGTSLIRPRSSAACALIGDHARHEEYSYPAFVQYLLSSIEEKLPAVCQPDLITSGINGCAEGEAMPTKQDCPSRIKYLNS